MDQNTKKIALPEPKNLNRHQWTNEEKVFKRKHVIWEQIKDLNLTFGTALLYKLSKSVFGSFLKELNQNQIQDKFLNENKMQILKSEFERYTPHDLHIISERNAIFRDHFNLLNKAINDCGVIDLGFLEKHLDNLSLNCCFIRQVDNSLRNFQNIQVLNLCGNYLKEIAGSFLPRNLKFLELFDNFLDNLKPLVTHIPKTLLHLGLGRNGITNDSSLHLISNSKNLRNLQSLDLSDNDICDLDSALLSLNEMLTLQIFSLEGNPCSVIPEYKNKVFMWHCNLQYFDFTEVLIKDINCLSNGISKTKQLLPQITFYCHRILGLPEPPKDTKNKQVFYIEVNFSLIIEQPIKTEESIELIPSYHQQSEIKDDLDQISKGTQSSKIDKAKKEKGKGKKDSSEKRDKANKKGKKKSYYTGANEYDKQFESRNVWFKTERVPWSNIMEFAPIFVGGHDTSLQSLRDTFRSIVPVRLIYLKIAPFSAKPKKTQGKPKKEKNPKIAGKEGINNTPTPELENVTEEQQQETVLKKVTLASFYCDLKSPNWSDNTVDFYWADHTDIGDTAIRVNGSLKAIEYDVNLASKKSREKVQKVKDVGENGAGENEKGRNVEARPNILTCQVGFGLNRY